ncbi:MAG: murein transglycosylase A [Rhodospirillales bacterium]|nr:murein transglycosylase A [Rhodospirillales bacterium]
MVAGCAGGKPPAPAAVPGTSPRLTLTPISFDQLPGWTVDHQAAALPAIRRSCARIASLPADRPMGGEGGIGGLAVDWRAACTAIDKVPAGNDATARYVIERWFVPHRATVGADDTGLFTGYYEAELRGSRKQGGRYQAPIYGLPADLEAAKAKNGGKYLTRAEIAGGTLSGKGLELLWADDPVDVYFLHVQGSGRVVMDDGRVVRLGYAGDNGHPYASLGRALIDHGFLAKEAVSMQSIRAWIAANPAQGGHMMGQNPRFIFFREDHGEGPKGAQGVALTPGRSLAVDPAFVPLGAPVWVDTVEPLAPKTPLRRLFVAQDTGSDIKGPIRGDLFFGFGSQAASQAGVMKARGRYFVLLPRKAAPPTS